jgi:UDP-3-O-[3-hydroxymyristoyl] glucosamine N-acyltransferase
VGVTVRQLAEWVGGQIVGDGGRVVGAARSLDEAGEGDVTYVEDARHLAAFLGGPAAAAIVPPKLTAAGKSLIVVPDPLMAFAAVVQRLHGRAEPTPSGVHPSAALHPTVRFGADPSVEEFVTVREGTVIGDRCRLAAGVRVGRGCRLGDDVVLHPNVVVYDGSVLGDRVIVHANAVLGADGFGYRFHQGGHVKVPQLGTVELGDDVEVGAGTTIDRGTFGATRIGAGTKIDNLVQIGHNCRIGRHNLVCGQVGIAGSSSTGDYVVLAGQVGVADHIHVGDGSVIGAQAGITRDVPAGSRYFGSPAGPERAQKRMMITLEKLPEMRRQLRRVLRQLGLDDTQTEAA